MYIWSSKCLILWSTEGRAVCMCVCVWVCVCVCDHLLCLITLLSEVCHQIWILLVQVLNFTFKPISHFSSFPIHVIRIQDTRNNPEFNASNTCPCVVYLSLSVTFFSRFFRLCLPVHFFFASCECVFQNIKNHRHVRGTWRLGGAGGGGGKRFAEPGVNWRETHVIRILNWRDKTPFFSPNSQTRACCCHSQYNLNESKLEKLN
jgi:hypothetical protein